jgi:hypothetical protein
MIGPVAVLAGFAWVLAVVPSLRTRLTRRATAWCAGAWCAGRCGIFGTSLGEIPQPIGRQA